MKLRILFILTTFVLSGPVWPVMADTTYNFYFQSDEEKAKQKEEEAKKKEEENQKLSDADITKLADEVARKLGRTVGDDEDDNEEDDFDDEMEDEDEQDYVPPVQFIKSRYNPKTEKYMSIGLGMESYFPRNLSTYVIRAKFFPLFAVEASIPNEVFGNHTQIYRVGGSFERKLFGAFVVKLNGGGVITHNKVNPYFGGGLKINLNAMELYADLNFMTRMNGMDKYLSWYEKDLSSLPFLSAGITFIF